MTPHTWRLLLHTTDGLLITYGLSQWSWRGSARVSGGLELLSTCRPHELGRVVDQAVDAILHLPPYGQPPLPDLDTLHLT